MTPPNDLTPINEKLLNDCAAICEACGFTKEILGAERGVFWFVNDAFLDENCVRLRQLISTYDANIVANKLDERFGPEIIQWIRDDADLAYLERDLIRGGSDFDPVIVLSLGALKAFLTGKKGWRFNWGLVRQTIPVV